MTLRLFETADHYGHVSPCGGHTGHTPADSHTFVSSLGLGRPGTAYSRYSLAQLVLHRHDDLAADQTGWRRWQR